MTSSPTKDGKEKVSIPSKSGKLRLPNYAAPPVVSPVSPTSSASSLPAQRSNSPPSPSIAQRPAPQDPVTQTRDCDSPSPASSTLSTPSASPNMVPRVMIGGHPANYAQPQQSHIDDWEWMAPSTQAVMSKRSTAQRSVTDGPAGLSGTGVPGLPPRAHSSAAPGPPGSDGLSGDSLYNAFVTRWCFAQGTSAAGPYHGGGDGGILA